MNLLFNEFIELLARRKFTKKKGCVWLPVT
jgi:hypothetical protein